MKTEIKQKWIDALRSGEYQQADGKLRSAKGYCCLGVLCDLYSKETVDNLWEFRGYDANSLLPHDYWYFDEESEFLPKSVMEWAELKENSPEVEVAVECDDDSGSFMDSIANVNDLGHSFDFIADLIEAQL